MPKCFAASAIHLRVQASESITPADPPTGTPPSGAKVRSTRGLSTLLEHSIQELRQYERDYRASIRSFIEAQLRDLETPTAPQTSPQGILGN